MRPSDRRIFTAALILISLIPILVSLRVIFAVNESKKDFDLGQSYFDTASSACHTGDFSRCLEYLYKARTKFTRARNQFDPSDPITSELYIKSSTFILQTEAMISLVEFSIKLEGFTAFNKFNELGPGDDPCKKARYAKDALLELESVQSDFDVMDGYAHNTMLPKSTQETFIDTINRIRGVTQVTEFLVPAFEAGCVISKEVTPKISSVALVTAANLKGNPVITQTRDKLEGSFTQCRDFVKNKPELATSLNFTFGECVWMQANADGLDSLTQMINSQHVELSNSSGLSEQGFFVAIRDYSDLVALVDPLDPDVRTLSALIARDHPGDRTYDQAKTLHKYVLDEVSYLAPPITKHQRVQTPATTISLKVGNCADKSVLLASMLMSVGFDVKAVFQDRNHTPQEIQQGASFEPTHMFVNVKVGDKWYYADTTCSFCDFGNYASPDKALVELDIPKPE